MPEQVQRSFHDAVAEAGLAEDQEMPDAIRRRVDLDSQATMAKHLQETKLPKAMWRSMKRSVNMLNVKLNRKMMGILRKEKLKRDIGSLSKGKPCPGGQPHDSKRGGKAWDAEAVSEDRVVKVTIPAHSTFRQAREILYYNQFKIMRELEMELLVAHADVLKKETAFEFF